VIRCKVCDREAAQEDDDKSARACEALGLSADGRVWTCSACYGGPYPQPFERVYEVACPRCTSAIDSLCVERGIDAGLWAHAERTNAWRAKERNVAPLVVTVDGPPN
jgi:hypothetical protein